MISITGTVGSTGKYLVTGMPVATKTPAVVKIAFENNTAGTNLGLYVGTTADFNAATGGTQLSDSGGPGFQFLSIVDISQFDSQVIFVRRVVGSAAASFTINIE